MEVISQISINTKLTTPKTFRDYYANPEYRKKHLEYISGKVQCPQCETMVARCNLSKHRQSMKHKKNDGLRQKNKEIDLNKMTEIILNVLKTYNEN